MKQILFILAVVMLSVSYQACSPPASDLITVDEVSTADNSIEFSENYVLECRGGTLFVVSKFLRQDSKASSSSELPSCPGHDLSLKAIQEYHNSKPLTDNPIILYDLSVQGDSGDRQTVDSMTLETSNSNLKIAKQNDSDDESMCGFNEDALDDSTIDLSMRHLTVRGDSGD